MDLSLYTSTLALDQPILLGDLILSLNPQPG